MAARFWIGGGTNSNWNASPTTNWCATSGGTTRVAAPTSSDDVTFDGAGAAGNSNSTVSATITCKSLTFTSGYTATITHNAVLTVVNNITFENGYTIAGSSNITVSGTSTITSNGRTWPNSMSFSGASATKTIVGNLTIGGTLTCLTNAQVINKTTSETITCNGYTGSIAASGTIDFIITGGTLTSSSATAFNSFTLNGTITITNFQMGGGSITYAGGAVTHTGTLTMITVSSTSTLDTAGIVWNVMSFSSSGINVVLNSTFTVGTINMNNNGGETFSGTAGFVCDTFSSTITTAQTITIQHAVEYVITTSLSVFSSRVGSIVSFTSEDATIKAMLTLRNGATCNCLANFTRIDASVGRSIQSFNGVITDCINVFSYSDIGEYPPIESRLNRRYNLYNRAKNVRYSV